MSKRTPKPSRKAAELAPRFSARSPESSPAPAKGGVAPTTAPWPDPLVPHFFAGWCRYHGANSSHRSAPPYPGLSFLTSGTALSVGGWITRNDASFSTRKVRGTACLIRWVACQVWICISREDRLMEHSRRAMKGAEHEEKRFNSKQSVITFIWPVSRVGYRYHRAKPVEPDPPASFFLL